MDLRHYKHALQQDASPTARHRVVRVDLTQLRIANEEENKTKLNFVEL